MGSWGLLRQIALATTWLSAVSLIGQSLTDLGPWYQQLRQPEWKPPDWALIELVFLWLSIAAIVFYFWKISRFAAVLLMPYLVWVTTADFLNDANIVLNP